VKAPSRRVLENSTERVRAGEPHSKRNCDEQILGLGLEKTPHLNGRSTFPGQGKSHPGVTFFDSDWESPG